MRTAIHHLAASAAAAVLTAVAAVPGQAQDGFFFKPPAVSLELRLGEFMRSAGSDVYGELTRSLTLEKNDFDAVSYGVSAAFRTSSRTDVVIGVGYARSTAASESRDFIGTDDQPIVQQTDLMSIPITAGLRVYPLSRGSAFGSYAWVPSRVTPYIGAGVGLMRYSLSQEGEFVDEDDLSISRDHTQSSGLGKSAYGEAGLIAWMNPHVGLQLDARYLVAKARMGQDYHLFDDIDLGGLQATAGFAVRF